MDGPTLLRSRSVRLRATRRGQHSLKYMLRAQCLGNGQLTNSSLWVTRQYTDEGSLLAGTSLEEIPEYEENKKILKTEGNRM